MRYLFMFLIVIELAFGWQLKGSQSTITINSLQNNYLWVYREGQWYECCVQTSYLTHTLYGGEGYWIYTPHAFSKNEYVNDKSWSEGWNLVAPVFEDWNMDSKFKNNILVGWKNIDNKWYLYGNYNYPYKFSTVKKGEGVWVYLPKIDTKIDNLPLFCKDGSCSKIINSTIHYKIAFKIEKNKEDKEIKFAFDLLRYSNNTHYKLAIGPFVPNTLDTSIPVCVEKAESAGKCKKIDNVIQRFLIYKENYIYIDSQKIANSFEKTIPNTKESFLMKIYVEGLDLAGFKQDEAFGTLGIDGFGTWVTLTNANRSASFEMEIR